MVNRQRAGALLVAVIMVMGTASGGAFVGLQPDDPAAGPTPDVDEENRQIDYDRGAYQLTLTPAINDSIDYELVVLGAAEPANDTASDIECVDELCTLDGDLDEGETAAYNVSGAILSVTPETDLDVGIEGTFDGDAAVGVGWGQINASEDVDDDLGDVADAVEGAKEDPPVDDPVDTDPVEEPGEDPVTDPPVDPDPEWDLSFEECTVVTISSDSDDEYEYEVDTVFLDDDGEEDTFTISDSGSGDTTVDTADHDTGANATDAMIRSVNVRDADGDVVLAEDHPDWDDCEEELYEQWENGNNDVITDSEIIVDVLNVSEINVDVGHNYDEEYITLENTADDPIDLSGWEVRDRDDGGAVSGIDELDPFVFSDGFILGAGEEVTIWTGEGTDNGSDLYWGYWNNLWHADGDTIIIEAPDGNQFIYEYEGGAPDNGNGDETPNGDENGEDDPNGADEVPAEAFSFEWENCHTVHIDVDDEYEDGGDWEVWEVTTSFYAEGNGYDTMVLEPGDELPTTIDANEHIDEAVTDVHIRHIMVAIDDPDEFEVAGESNPDGDECGEQIQQQWEEYQDGNGDADENGDEEANGDENDEDENGDEEANDEDENGDEEANDEDENGDEEANGDENGEDENGDEETNGDENGDNGNGDEEANGDGENGDEEANGEENSDDEVVESGDDDSDDEGAVGLMGDLGTALLFAAYSASIFAFTVILARGFWRGGDGPMTGRST